MCALTVYTDPMNAPVEYVPQTFSGIVTKEDTRPQDDPHGAMTEDYWNGLLDGMASFPCCIVTTG